MAGARQAFRRVALRLVSSSVSDRIDPFSSVINVTPEFPKVRSLFLLDISA
jgi:hypothetical protein